MLQLPAHIPIDEIQDNLATAYKTIQLADLDDDMELLAQQQAILRAAFAGALEGEIDDIIDARDTSSQYL